MIDLPEDRLVSRLRRFLPAPLARVLAVEWVIARSALGPTLRAASGGRSFDYVSDSPLKLLVLAYPLAAIGDSVLVWALLQGHPLVHLGVAAVTVYGFVWLLGIYRTMLARPHVLDAGVLRVHRGVLGTAAIPVADVESLAIVPEGERVSGDGVRLDVGGRRLSVRLRRPLACDLYGGMRKQARRIVLSVDDPEALRAALSEETPPRSPHPP